MLKTIDVNQNAFTAFAATLPVSPYENCKLVEVTEEKKVAMAVRLSKLSVLCFCENWMVGTPGISSKGERNFYIHVRRSDSPTSMNRERAEEMPSMCSPRSEDRS